MAYGVVLVDGRQQARTIDDLAMRCDARELSYPLEDAKADTHWIGIGEMSGHARRLQHGAMTATDEEFTSTGGVAMVVTSDRVIGIVSPDAVAEPAVWFAAPLATLGVEAAGSQGMFRKRPVSVDLTSEGWKLRVVGVGHFFVHSKSLQSGQEADFVKALGRP